jgi:hypothetical protein
MPVKQWQAAQMPPLSMRPFEPAFGDGLGQVTCPGAPRSMQQSVQLCSFASIVFISENLSSCGESDVFLWVGIRQGLLYSTICPFVEYQQTVFPPRAFPREGGPSSLFSVWIIDQGTSAFQNPRTSAYCLVDPNLYPSTHSTPDTFSSGQWGTDSP